MPMGKGAEKVTGSNLLGECVNKKVTVELGVGAVTVTTDSFGGTTQRFDARQLRGILLGYDDWGVVLDVEGKKVLVSKSAMATVGLAEA
jgi:hypothetical protein